MGRPEARLGEHAVELLRGRRLILVDDALERLAEAVPGLQAGRHRHEEVGQLVLEVPHPLLRLERGEEVGQRRAAQEAERDQRHRLCDARGDEAAQEARRRASGRRTPRCGAAGRPARARTWSRCHGLNLPRAFSVAWKRPVKIFSRWRPVCLTRRWVATCGSRRPLSHEPRGEAKANAAARRTMSPTTTANEAWPQNDPKNCSGSRPSSSGLRVTTGAPGDDHVDRGGLAARRGGEGDLLARERRGDVLEAPRAGELLRDRAVDLGERGGVGGAVVLAAGLLGDALERLRVEAGCSRSRRRRRRRRPPARRRSRRRRSPR